MKPGHGALVNKDGDVIWSTTQESNGGSSAAPAPTSPTRSRSSSRFRAAQKAPCRRIGVAAVTHPKTARRAYPRKGKRTGRRRRRFRGGRDGHRDLCVPPQAGCPHGLGEGIHRHRGRRDRYPSRHRSRQAGGGRRGQLSGLSQLQHHVEKTGEAERSKMWLWKQAARAARTLPILDSRHRDRRGRLPLLLRRLRWPRTASRFSP